MRRIVIISTLAMVITGGALAKSIGSTGDASSVTLSSPSASIGEVTLEATVADVDEDAVSWAQDRFREAGLSLPEIRVSFQTETESCEGSKGGHLIEEGMSNVFICVPDQGPTRDLQIKRVLLHEFAHAWDHHALTDQHRSEFLAYKDFSGWSFEVPYDERASEDAAEIIAWGLMDRPILFNSLDETWSWEERLDGYRILTGAAPPHGYVWSLWVASHDIYAHTPSQVDIVKKAWELSRGERRLTEWIEVRFNEDSKQCNDALTSSVLIDGRLHIQACPGLESELTTALVDEFTGG